MNPGSSLNIALNVFPTVPGSFDNTVSVSAIETDPNPGNNTSIEPFTVGPAPALINHWAAENNALDSVGGNHGTLEGGAGFGPGRVGQAFSLDGINDSV